MKKEIFTCDGCGKEKGENNHWFAVTLNDDLNALGIASFATALKHPKPSGNDWEFFCGEECLLKMVARNLPK